MVGCVAIIALFGVVELVFRAYEFNTKGHKNDAEVLARDKMKRKGQITNSTTQQWDTINDLYFWGGDRMYELINNK